MGTIASSLLIYKTSILKLIDVKLGMLWIQIQLMDKPLDVYVQHLGATISQDQLANHVIILKILAINPTKIALYAANQMAISWAQ